MDGPETIAADEAVTADPPAPRPLVTYLLCALCLVLVLSIVTLVWAPWSPHWVGYRAYQAHLAGDYAAAAEGYERSITLGGEPTWALSNLARLHQTTGSDREYRAVVDTLRALDPGAADEVDEAVGRTSSDEAKDATVPSTDR